MQARPGGPSVFDVERPTVSTHCCASTPHARGLVTHLPAVICVDQVNCGQSDILLLQTLYHVLDTEAMREQLYLSRESETKH